MLTSTHGAHQVQLPFLRPFALRAQQALLAHSRETAALTPPLPPPRAPPASALQERTLRLLHALADTAEVVGAQVRSSPGAGGCNPMCRGCNPVYTGCKAVR